MLIQNFEKYFNFMVFRVYPGLIHARQVLD